MANVLIDESTMVSIADAIREKASAGKMLPSEMPDVIKNNMVGRLTVTNSSDVTSFEIVSNLKKADISAISVDALGDVFVSSGNAYIGTMLYWKDGQNGTYGIASANNWGNLQGKKIAEDFVTETSSGFSISPSFGVFKAGVPYVVAIYPKGE